jgi:hypothetical protein
MFTFRDLNKQLTVSSLGLSLFGLLTLNVAAQAPTQTVAADAPTEVSFHLVYVGSNDPVKVTHVMLGDRDVPLDTPVPVSGMWFRKVGIVVQNVSPKTAVHGLVTLEFPETGDGTPSKPILSSALSLGRYPSNFFMQKDGTLRDSSREDKETVINVMPGESMTFGAHDGVDHTYGDVIQPEAFRLAGHPITKINITLGRFFFGDGSLWLSGIFAIPAPPPVVWKKITPTEFFGGTLPGSR